MIEIKNLTKIYPNGKQALYPFDLQIQKSMFGLVGPKGAGKTTLMRILATLLRPTSGDVSVYGNNINNKDDRMKIKEILGYLPQNAGFHEKLTVEQEIDYFARMKGITNGTERTEQIALSIERAGLDHVRGERIHTLSGGMKRRLGIAITLLGSPRIIIVDEPTAGLDPAERVRFRNLLFDLSGDRIVILSTHIIEDISQICTDLAILSDGSIIFHDSPKKLITQVEGYTWLVPSHELKQNQDYYTISSKSSEDGIEQRVFSEEKPTPLSRLLTPTLEDAYLWLIQKEFKTQ